MTLQASILQLQILPVSDDNIALRRNVARLLLVPCGRRLFNALHLLTRFFGSTRRQSFQSNLSHKLSALTAVHFPPVLHGALEPA